MSANLTIFEEFSCVDVKNRHLPLGDEGGREATTGCIDGSDNI